MRRTPVDAGTLTGPVRPIRLVRSAVVGAVCAVAALLVCAADTRDVLLTTDAPVPSDAPGAWVLLAGLSVLLGLPVALAGAFVRTVPGGPTDLVVVARPWRIPSAPVSGAGPPPPVAPDLLTTLSHEIRTPLSALLGMTDLLLGGSLDPLQRVQLGSLRHSGMQILGLVNDVLDRGSVQAGRLTVTDQPFELPDLLADVVELMHVEAASKGIRLHVELDPSCPSWVRGDVSRLRQVLVNLVANAVKFSDAGVVTVEVCRAARTEPPSALYFQVTDTGRGIPSDRAGEIFEPWSRVVPTDSPLQAGAGLGLAISQALVRGMGGEIVVTSQEDVGSTFGFEVVLPAEPVPDPVATSLAGRRVVLLDRQPLRAARTAARLHEWGAEVEVAHPRDDTGEPDLVVLWEDRPDELAALVARRRQHPGAAPLVVVTADAHALTAQMLLQDDLVVGATPAGRRLRLALASLARPGTDGSDARPAADGDRPLRVLLAEDDPVSRSVGAMLVRRLGHEVDVVADGAAAVLATASATYDLVLMDSQMPGLDGVEATRAVRSAEPPGRRVRVVALTGALSPAEQAAYALAGMDDVLAKPLTRDTLVQVLAAVPREHVGRAPVLAEPHHPWAAPGRPVSC